MPDVSESDEPAAIYNRLYRAGWSIGKVASGKIVIVTRQA